MRLVEWGDNQQQVSINMKKLLSTLILAFALLGLSGVAEARDYHRTHTYRSGYADCGCAVYKKKIFRGYDRCGYPIYRRVAIPIKHRCGYHKSRVNYRSGGLSVRYDYPRSSYRRYDRSRSYRTSRSCNIGY